MKTFVLLAEFFLVAIVSTSNAANAGNLGTQPKMDLYSDLERTETFGGSTPMQQSYELRCRGGGGLKFNSTPGRILPTGGQMMNVTVDFVAGTQGANSPRTSLNPGQCSWVDRGLNQAEPKQIRLEMVYFAQQQQALHGSAVDHSPTAAERFPDAQNVPPYLTSSDHYWSFWVYNTNNGYLQATSQRYLRPFKLHPNDKVKILRPR